MTAMTEDEFLDALDELDDDHARAVTARIAGKTLTYQVRPVRASKETP